MVMDIDGVMIHDGLGTTPPACMDMPYIEDPMMRRYMRLFRVSYHAVLLYGSSLVMIGCCIMSLCNFVTCLGSRKRNVSSLLEQTARSMTNNRFALAGQWKNGMLNRMSEVKLCLLGCRPGDNLHVVLIDPLFVSFVGRHTRRWGFDRGTETVAGTIVRKVRSAIDAKT